MSSSVARVLTLAAVFLALASNVAKAQLIESPLDSEEAKEEGLPFRGSSFGFYQSMTGNSLARGSTLSYDPTYSWAFDLTLLWHFNRRFQLILDQGLNVEITSSDITLHRREPRLTDTTATFGALLLKQNLNTKAQFILNGSAGINAPTSLASQAATMILGTRVGLTGTLSLPKILQGAGINGSIGYLHRFLRQNVAEVADSGFPCVQGPGSSAREFCTAFGGLTNARLALTASVSGELALTEKWGLSASYTHSWRRGANLADLSGLVTSDDAPITLANGSDHHWRNVNTLDLTITYFATGWLGLGASATNIFQERGPDSAIRPPFRPMDTYLGLNVNLRLDELYLAANPPAPKEDD